MNTRPLILHIPHASTRIPPDCKRDFTADLSRELRCMTDWYTDDLFDCPAVRVVFPVSRLICDPERFREDEREPMSRCGMGACYTHGHDGAPIRTLTAARREDILRRWYDPHHRILQAATAELLERFGFCLIVDCHSFFRTPLPYEPDQRPDRPDICIGTDPFHTPARVGRAAADAFARRGYRVGYNTPYAGTMVPLPCYRADPRVRSVMIEINRGLYLDGDCRKAPAFSGLRQVITQAVEQALAAAGPRE